MYSDPHFPVELPGIEPGLLPGEMLSELQFHYRLDPLQSRSLPVGSFSGLDGVKSGHLPPRAAGFIIRNGGVVPPNWTMPSPRAGIFVNSPKATHPPTARLECPASRTSHLIFTTTLPFARPFST